MKNAIIKLVVVASVVLSVVFSWPVTPAFAFNFSSANILMITSTEQSVDNTVYKVVVNYEEQYSIWPADREVPLGWKDAGKTGSKEECLAYIKEVWTDMRPLSLRRKMEEAARNY
ncbi:MbtH domain-containing protein [Nostoc linckia NIES-25]|nr:MbtH domain-containing protein [Nostoc linckia NIES-25]